MNPPLVRRAAVAGLFYPADPEQLRGAVGAMLVRAPAASLPGPVRMLLSPHAGYDYSGAVAAGGFRLLRDQVVKTVVLVSPSHVERFDHTSVFAGGAYETPLGRVAVDLDLARRLASSHPTIAASECGHVQAALRRREHGLEVQLPLLQSIHPDARIVPIVMGNQDWEHCAALGEALLANSPDGTVFLASSDLSHFYPYEHARKLDAVFLDTLSALDPRELHQRVEEGACEACGAGPVVAALIASAAGEARYEELARANSGDVTGDHDSVVGYACAVIHAGAA